MIHKRKFNKSFKGFVMLALAVVFLTSSVFAVDPSPSPTPESAGDLAYQQEINEYIMAQLIYMCLDAWGIQISYNDVVEFNDEVNNLIVNWVFEYLETIPSVHSINQWIAPWQSGFDYWGNWAGNATLLEDVQDFVDWLLEKFGLEDNEEVVINPNYVLGAYNLYELSTWYQADKLSGQQDYFQINNNLAVSGVYYFVQIDDDEVNFYFVTSNSSYAGQNLGTYTLVLKDANGGESTKKTGTIHINNNNISTISGNYLYYGRSSSWSNYYPYGGHYFEGSQSECVNFLKTAVISVEGNTKFITENIELPVDNPDYVSGDSIQIIDGQPFYIEITFPDHITVDNLPAVIVKPSVENPNFHSIWHYVSDLKENISGGTQLLRLTMSELPDEILGAFYAFLALGIIFGFIKIMRK